MSKKKHRYFSKARALTKKKDEKKSIALFVWSLPSQVFEKAYTVGRSNLKDVLEGGLLRLVDDQKYVVEVHFCQDPTFYDQMPSPINCRVKLECSYSDVAVSQLQDAAVELISQFCRRIWRRNQKLHPLGKEALILRISFSASETHYPKSVTV